MTARQQKRIQRKTRQLGNRLMRRLAKERQERRMEKARFEENLAKAKALLWRYKDKEVHAP